MQNFKGYPAQFKGVAVYKNTIILHLGTRVVLADTPDSAILLHDLDFMGGRVENLAEHIDLLYGKQLKYKDMTTRSIASLMERVGESALVSRYKTQTFLKYKIHVQGSAMYAEVSLYRVYGEYVHVKFNIPIPTLSHDSITEMLYQYMQHYVAVYDKTPEVAYQHMSKLERYSEVFPYAVFWKEFNNIKNVVFNLYLLFENRTYSTSGVVTKKIDKTTLLQVLKAMEG